MSKLKVFSLDEFGEMEVTDNDVAIGFAADGGKCYVLIEVYDDRDSSDE